MQGLMAPAAANKDAVGGEHRVRALVQGADRSNELLGDTQLHRAEHSVLSTRVAIDGGEVVLAEVVSPCRRPNRRGVAQLCSLLLVELDEIEHCVAHWASHLNELLAVDSAARRLPHSSRSTAELGPLRPQNCFPAMRQACGRSN